MTATEWLTEPQRNPTCASPFPTVGNPLCWGRLAQATFTAQIIQSLRLGWSLWIPLSNRCGFGYMPPSQGQMTRRARSHFNHCRQGTRGGSFVSGESLPRFLNFLIFLLSSFFNISLGLVIGVPRGFANARLKHQPRGRPPLGGVYGPRLMSFLVCPLLFSLFYGRVKILLSLVLFLAQVLQSAENIHKAGRVRCDV